MMATFWSASQSLGLKRPPGCTPGFSFFICSRFTGASNSTRRGPTGDKRHQRGSEDVYIHLFIKLFSDEVFNFLFTSSISCEEINPNVKEKLNLLLVKIISIYLAILCSIIMYHVSLLNATVFVLLFLLNHIHEPHFCQ